MASAESAFVLGQRYTLATMALVLAILSFLNLAGMEKAIVAMVFAFMALKGSPPPALTERRGWARFAVGLAATHIVLVTTIILLNLDRLAKVYEVLQAMSELR
jgi:hypothetical protein